MTIERKRERENARNARLRAERAGDELRRRLRALDDPGESPAIGAPAQRSSAAGVCAVCTAPAPAGSAMRPLGRAGALVIVCAACDDEHPRSGRYSFGEASALPRPTAGGNDGNRRRGPRGT